MAVEGIIIELGSTDQIDVDIGSTEHIEGGPGEAKFLPGPQGPQGETGEPGVSVSDISVERTSGTGAAGTTDTYTGTVSFDDGTSTTFTFDVYNGEDGEVGAAATIAVGNVSGGETASVTNSGTSSAAVFDFVLPKGDKGDEGDKGETGDPGSAATIAVGNVSKGENASVTNSGTSSAAVFDFVLPKGDKGDTGDTGATGATGTSVTGVTVARTSGTGAAGTTDTYTGTVSFSNGTSTTFTFNVYNGADGQGTGDMLKSVYDTDNDGVVDDAEKLGGQSPDYYAKAANGIYYAKTAGNGIAQVATIPGITQYYDGLCVALIFNVATSRDATININNLGAVPLRDNTDSASATNTDSVYSPGGAMRIFVYDSANSLFRGVYDYSTYDRIHMVATEGSNAAKQANIITQNNNYFHAPCYQLVYFNFDNTAQSALTLGLWNGPYAGSVAPIYINGEASSATNYTLPKGLYLVLWDGTNYYVNTNGTLPGTQAPLTFDSTPTASSTNPVTSGGVYNALAPLRSVDAAPTPGSTNLVESGGVYGVLSNRNLLDNGWFTINQRGQNSYTGNAYTVDRWRFQNNSGTCTVVSGGIQFSNSASGYGYFTQILDFPMDGAKTYMLSVIADGQAYSAKSGGTGITLPSGLYFYFANYTQITVRVPGNLNSSEVISAVKLELGSVSTLANDAPPNYAEELAKCQRFFYRFSGLASSYTIPGSSVSAVTIQFPVTMKGVPAISNITHYDSKTSNGQGTFVSGARFYNSSNVGFSVTGFDVSADL